MTSIPAAICRIFCNNFKRYYLKNGRLILDFLIEILKYAWNLEHLEKKDESASVIIVEIIVSERGFYWNI